MRLPLAALLALPAAFLSSLVLAVPSPVTHVEQQPFEQSDPFSALTRSDRPRWRRLTDHVIDSIFGPWPTKACRRSRRGATAAEPALPYTQARYGSDVVLRFNISTAKEARSFAEAADTLLLDIWEFSHNWVDIRLSMDMVKPLLGLLPASLQHSHTPLLQERALAQAIYDTYPRPRDDPDHPSRANGRSFSPSVQPGEGNIFFSDYQPLSVIGPWQRLMASLFDTHVRKVHIGVSYQGRDIDGLRVGVHPTNDEEGAPKRKTILVYGGLHAREWISISTVNYLAYSFITGYGKVPGITQLLEAFDFVFIPTVNPDGYVYTWETDRLWRKNRQQTNFRFCQGIDLDRNFGFEWDGATTTAGNPCSESFAGESPFEAVEAKRLADWAWNETEHNNVEFVGLLDLHSYSQQVLYPYAYSCDDEPPGLENLEEMAIGLAKAIRLSHGHAYEVLPACEGNVASSQSKERRLWPRMEASGGSALDWFYHELHVRFAYQIKLRDRGAYGFLLPRENIIPTGKELLDALIYLGSELGEMYYDNRFGLTKKFDNNKETEHDDNEYAGPLDMTYQDDESPDDQIDPENWIWVDEGGLDRSQVSWELKRRRRL